MATVEIELCGWIGPRKRSGACEARRVPGAKRCWHHGGRWPKAHENAKLRWATAQVRSEMQKGMLMAGYGNPVEISPGDALMLEVSRTQGHVVWLANKIMTLREEDIAGLMRTKEESKTSTGSGESDDSYDLRVDEVQTNIWQQLYFRERQHLVGVASAAVKMGLDERAIQATVEQQTQLNRILIGVLTALGLDPRAPEVMMKVQAEIMKVVSRRVEEIEE